MQAKKSVKKRNTGFQAEKVDKYLKAKAQGLTNVAASKVAGYSPSYNPMKSTLAQITLEEAYAQEGLDNHYFAKQIKNVIEGANKYIAAGTEVYEEPDWQNRVRALELWGKTSDKMSATKSKLEVDVRVNPYAQLSDEELNKELILEGEVLEDEKYAPLEEIKDEPDDDNR